MINRELVKIERVLSPEATLKQIAAKFGITRERVRQILAKANLPTRHRTPGKSYYACNNCGRVFPPHGSRSPNIFCSWECFKLYHQANKFATLACDECGKLFKLRYTQLSARVKHGQKHFFCSRSCNGRSVGKNYGFSAHPENAGRAHN